jgi:RNA polymerase sigma factor (sigma-70 family)
MAASPRADGPSIELDGYTWWLVSEAARHICRWPGLSEHDRPDVEQQLATHVWQRLKRFDPARSSRMTYIRRVLDSEVKSILRSLGSQRAMFQSCLQSLADAVCGSDGEPVERFALVDDASRVSHRGVSPRADVELWQLRDDVRDVVDDLPPELRELCHLLFEHSQREIARRQGRSRRAVREDVARILELFDDADLRDYL